jgi:hypothetical protein
MGPCRLIIEGKEMKRFLALVFVCGAGSCIAAGAAPVKHAAPLSAAQKKANAEHAARIAAALYASMAPADEYFGPLKLSIIGIHNSIRDIGLRYKYNSTLAAPSFASAQLVERAIRDWAHRYAHDPQLPRNVFALQRLYTQILLQSSRDRAHVIAQWMATSFATSPQEKQLKKTLALEHLAPIPTPSPTPVPTDTPTASPEPSPSPEPSITESPQPGASETSRPQERSSQEPASPSPSPSAGQNATPTPQPPVTPLPVPPTPIPYPSPAGPSPSPEPTAGASPEPAPTATLTPTPTPTR